MTEEERKQDLRDRVEALFDKFKTYLSLYPETSTPIEEFMDSLVEQADTADAEAKVVALETKDSEIKAAVDAYNVSEEKIMADYYKARNDEYNARGVTRDAIMEAQWEKDMENKPEKADALQVIRNEVKALIPKPTF